MILASQEVSELGKRGRDGLPSVYNPSYQRKRARRPRSAGGPRVQAAAVSWIGIPAGTPRSGWRFGVDQGVHWSVPPQLAAAACDETLKRRPAAFAATVRTWTSGLA